MSGTDSSAKKTPVNIGSRSAPITTYGNGPQLRSNDSRQLMRPMSGVERFSFSPSFWQSHDDIEWKSEADDSDITSNRWHSLPAQDYHNVTKTRGS